MVCDMDSRVVVQLMCVVSTTVLLNSTTVGCRDWTSIVRLLYMTYWTASTQPLWLLSTFTIRTITQRHRTNRTWRGSYRDVKLPLLGTLFSLSRHDFPPLHTIQACFYTTVLVINARV